MPWTFRTVPDELLPCAEAVADYYRALGYVVTEERGEIGFPNTPTIHTRRGNTRLAVEVVTRVDEGMIRRWVAFGKSSGSDFRVVVALSGSTELPISIEGLLRDLGVGCILHNEGLTVERIAPADLALNVELPELGEMPARMRAGLGPAYEHFRNGYWREGFSDACQAFENEARKYLKRHSRTGRVLVLRRSTPVQLSAREINKMTMGQLAGTFRFIVNRNVPDTVVGETLAAVNKDRVGVAHKKASKAVETRLRLNVGRHMWTLVAGFREVIK